MRKEYILCDDVDINQLIMVGFKYNKTKDKLVLYKNLYKEIDLFIEISLYDFKYEEAVIDEDFGQYYMPFYEGMNNEYVNRSTEAYYIIMDNLVSLGLFKEAKENELVK